MGDKITISIDLGTTFTGVAWMTNRTPISVMNDWPGSGDRGERKVPTTLVYNSDGSLSSWGFRCEEDGEAGPGKTRREFFKIFIDSDTLKAAQKQGFTDVPQSTDEARQFIIDYLKEIYRHVKGTIEDEHRMTEPDGWREAAVSFLFSVPTTWKRQGIINTFKGIIRAAGFGVEGRRHEALVDLTEAEAASVETLKNSATPFQESEIFLTVDAGGGTTDLALMRVDSTHATFPRISQVAAVNGIGIGSSLIDRAFVRLVNERLDANPDAQSRLPFDLANNMARGHHFKTVKHKFGSKPWTQKIFKLQMDGVSHEFSHFGLKVENGKMLFTKEEIQTLFDVQIMGILRKITIQLDWMQKKEFTEQVAYMILAGGLGSSEYVRDKLEEHLKQLCHPNASNVAVMQCREPQLVVVRGLLVDRQQKAQNANTGVLTTRIARASYGVVIRDLYSPTEHDGEDTRRDSFDSTVTWAMNQIQWLIRKGDKIESNTPLKKSLAYRIGENETRRSWDTTIVVSHNEPKDLPKSLRHAGATTLCSVTSNLDGIQNDDLERIDKRGGCCGFAYKTYFLCQFELRVIVAPADLRFELWFKGVKFSGNHEPVSIDWNPAE